MNNKLVQKTKKLFLEKLATFKDDPYQLKEHLNEVEKWARHILKKYPEANDDVVMLTVWLHDIAHYPITDKDHAEVGEHLAKVFLVSEKVDKVLTDKVAHSVRSHRNRDVLPETLEAKLFAMIDSLSHFTYLPYFSIIRDGRSKYAFEKLERDYNDTKAFPEIQKEMTPLYKAIKKTMAELDKIKL